MKFNCICHVCGSTHITEARTLGAAYYISIDGINHAVQACDYKHTSAEVKAAYNRFMANGGKITVTNQTEG